MLFTISLEIWHSLFVLIQYFCVWYYLMSTSIFKQIIIIVVLLLSVNFYSVFHFKNEISWQCLNLSVKVIVCQKLASYDFNDNLSSTCYFTIAGLILCSIFLLNLVFTDKYLTEQAENMYKEKLWRHVCTFEFHTLWSISYIIILHVNWIIIFFFSALKYVVLPLHYIHARFGNQKQPRHSYSAIAACYITIKAGRQWFTGSFIKLSGP